MPQVSENLNRKRRGGDKGTGAGGRQEVEATPVLGPSHRREWTDHLGQPSDPGERPVGYPLQVAWGVMSFPTSRENITNVLLFIYL